MKMGISAQRLIFPLLVSFSLTGATVILIHYYKKTIENEKKKKDRKDTVEMSIAREFVPLIIGRGGMTTRCIEQSTNTIITFSNEDFDSNKQSCTITGKLEDIKIAEEKIKSILKNQPVIETYEMWIPQGTIINILGKGRRIMNRIQNSSNAKLIFPNKLDADDPKMKKRVIIKGTAEQIADALTQLEDQVREDNEALDSSARSSLNRVPRVKINSRADTPDNNLKDFEHARESITPVDGFLDVFVSAVINPSQFYIQVIGPINAQLDDLIAEMTTYYENEENHVVHALRKVTVEQMVAAKYTDDKWYRAQILADRGDEVYDVYFVDFGDQEIVDKTKLLDLRTDFLSLRLQAIEVSLAGVKPRDGNEWPEQTIKAFSELTAYGKWEPRVAKIKGYKERVAGSNLRREGSPVPCIELFSKSGNTLFNIGKELIKREFAAALAENWSQAGSTLSLSRSRSPEATSGTTASTSDGGSAFEEIDLVSPNKQMPTKKIELIDLGTPRAEEPPKNGESRDFLENERGSSRSNGRRLETSNETPKNPFKPASKEPLYNVVPAGFEDELSDGSDDFELN